MSVARPPDPQAWGAPPAEPGGAVAKPGRPNEGARAFKPPRQRCPAAACVPHARAALGRCDPGPDQPIAWMLYV
ncbi:hypothetical protein EMIT0158MI4_140066 [Burkholderia ambifaria]